MRRLKLFRVKISKFNLVPRYVLALFIKHEENSFNLTELKITQI